MIDGELQRPEPAASGPAPPKRGPGRPRKVPADQQRETVLVAATKVFAERGYAETTADHLAEASGVARPTIYDLIGSKSEVFVAATRRALDRIMQRYAAAVSTPGSQGRGRALAHIGAYFQMLSEEPETLRLVRYAAVAGEAAAEEVVRHHRSELERAIAAEIQRNDDVAAAGGLPDADARVAAVMLLAGLEAVAFDALEHPAHAVERLCEVVTELYRNGILGLVAFESGSTDVPTR